MRRNFTFVVSNVPRRLQQSQVLRKMIYNEFTLEKDDYKKVLVNNGYI
jgi:hypothetical protein